MWLTLGMMAWAGGDGRPDAFRQLDEVWPTPNNVRTVTGRPGSAYWQQRVDYDMQVTIDEPTATLTGSETITYHNNSPDTLDYLWVHLEPDLLKPTAQGALMAAAPDIEDMSYKGFANLLGRTTFDANLELSRVEDAEGNPLATHPIDTTMRVDLASPLAPGEHVVFDIDWSYQIVDATLHRARSGYETLDDGRRLFELAQFYPRVAAYTDAGGWHHDPFTGRGEFTTEFGDYTMAITVPDNHVVAATGELVNPERILEPRWIKRLEQADSAREPVTIISAAEAGKRGPSKGTKTWTYKAENVRDVAFASSSRFAWDAMRYTPEGGEPVWAMSYWPPAGDALWARYSTWAVVHTLDVYSDFAFPYPYPVAISVNGPVGGMEYPMICFNGPRPTDEGDWYGVPGEKMPWKHSKNGLISVIIHEVGHNWYPMIVNSDERHWTWMDEGLNSYVQFLAEATWEPDYPRRRGEPRALAEYMASPNRVPVMTQSDSLLQFGNNAYATPAVALNYLRESILGRERMDDAFRAYSKAWAFKRPNPADFFRIMEDVSGEDLDWFWRGWFYSTDHVDVEVTGVTNYQINTQNPEIESDRKKRERDEEPISLSKQRDEGLRFLSDSQPELLDYYSTYDALDVTAAQRAEYVQLLDALTPSEQELLKTRKWFTVIDLVNHGGLVTNVPLLLTFEDGSTEELRLPVDLWRKDARSARKLVVSDQAIASVRFDPHWETPDSERSNDIFPREVPTRQIKLKPQDVVPPPMRLP